jgi:hypothetical protein
MERGQQGISIPVSLLAGLFPVLWNKLAALQDAHDQENNAPSAPLAK